ncbi:unnamed protein product, partial [Rangifer tarandus platyrhynchus]
GAGRARVGRRPAAPGVPPRAPRPGSCTCPDPGFQVGRPSSPAPMEQTDAHGRAVSSGGTESHRGHQKGCVASPSGNRTPVSRVTGGDTHHYTNEDGGHRPAARPLSGCLPPPIPCPPRAPTRPPTTPTASVTEAARDPDRDPDTPGHWTLLVRAASCLQRGHSAGRRGSEKASEAARTRWARAGPRLARRGARGRGAARQGPGW